ncbi:uncharacterized protein H6S33_010841 [Morchella sextelata]|uniref:uncharacterized protein n=1 Tax=Morchella sextelata TaxID=1174677 RepID=UPI001D04C18B|nr:uncharacterized protein H6S33_010841 [Morchella sextelata]KAH0611576.1 hypothetical protein H6S33_010841 [Morchella sextelata]
MSSPIPAPHATPPRLRRDVSPPVTPDRPRLPAQIHLHRAASRRAISVEQEYMATVGLRDWHECLIPVDIHLEPEVRVALPARLTEIPVTLPVIVGPVGRLWRVWSVMKGAFRLVWGRAGGVMGFVFRLWINGCAFARERSMGEGK